MMPRLRILLRSESLKYLVQTILALLIDAIGIIAGTILALGWGILSSMKWSIALYPAILTMRGVVNGIFCGRISTGLHLGFIRPSLRDITWEFKILISSIVVFALTCSIFMIAQALVFGLLVWNVPVVEFLNVVLVILSTMFFSLVIISPITFTIAVASYRAGLDPDMITYPVMSTIADIIVTILYILIIYVLLTNKIALIPVSALFTFSSLALLLKYREEEEFIRTIGESIVVLIIVSMITGLTGTFLLDISLICDNPLIIALYPALIDMSGDVGSIIGSVITTRLALGILTPSLYSIKVMWKNTIITWISSILMYLIFPLMVLSIFRFELKLYTRSIPILLSTNILTIPIIIIISILIASLTYRKGLDPDNFVNPIESSLADMITSLMLLASIRIIAP